MKFFITGLTFLFASIITQAQYVSATDGSTWLHGQEQYWSHHIMRKDTSREAYNHPGRPMEKLWERRFSPSLLYHMYETEQKTFDKKKKKYISENVTYLVQQVPYSMIGLDADYRGIAVLDDGRILASAIKPDNTQSSLQNLYLYDIKTSKSTILYNGLILQSQMPSPHNPRVAVSADNKLIAVFAASGIILADVQQSSTKMLHFPDIEAGWKIEETNQVFFAENSSLLCLAGAVTQGEGALLVRKRFLTSVNVSTDTKIATLLNPFISGAFSAFDYRTFKDKVYKLDAKRAELIRIAFTPGKIATAEIIKWDTTLIPQSMRNTYYPHLMQMGDTITLALIPAIIYRAQDASVFMLNPGNGKLYKKLPYYMDQTAKYAKARAASAKKDAFDAANVQYEKKQCADGEELARQYEGLSYNGKNGRTYILDYDCKAKQFIVGYFKFSLVYGPSGLARSMPHHYINIDLGGAPRSELSDDGKRVCTACNGTPANSKISSSIGWTKRYVLGAVYYIQDDVVIKNTEYTMCKVCKGAGTVRK